MAVMSEMDAIKLLLIVVAIGFGVYLLKQYNGRILSQLAILEKSFKIDKVYKLTTHPIVALNTADMEIGLVYPDRIVRMPLSDILSWKHGWVEKSSNAGLSTGNHFVEFTVRDINSPLIKVECTTKKAAEDLYATFNVLMKG
jgi:hypothetical protein